MMCLNPIYSNRLHLIGIGVVLLLSLSSLVSGNSCDTLQSRADRYIKKMLLLNTNQSIPRTDEEILAYCKATRRGFNLATKYQKCLPPFPRQILALFISGAGKSVRYVCDDPGQRGRVQNYLSCLRSDNIDRVYSLVGRSLTIVEYIGLNVTADSMILPYACCSYHFIYDRALRFLNAQCPDKSTAVSQFIATLLDLTLSEIIEIGCSKYSSLSVCVKKIPQAMENIKSARSPDSLALDDRSIVEPILQIANRLIDDPIKERSKGSQQ